jgi:hypothetical protein
MSEVMPSYKALENPGFSVFFRSQRGPFGSLLGTFPLVVKR